jgi:hypothetical protein
MPIPAVVLAVGSLAALAALLPRRSRMLVELGAAMLALGHAALVVAYHLPLGARPAPIALTSIPHVAARIDAALVLLGAVLPLVGAALAWREWKWKSIPAAPLAAAVGGWQLLHHARLIAAEGVLPVLGTALVAAAALALGGVGWQRLVRRPAPIELTAPWLAGNGRIVAWSAIAAGSALALLGPHTLLVLGGAVIAAAGMDGLRLVELPAHSIPWRSVVVIGSLGYVAWFLVPIAGPIGLAHATLPDVPVSAAAAMLLTPPVAIAALVLASPFPLDRKGRGLMLVPVAGALLARTALPLLASGLDGWRTLLLPAGVLLTVLAAFTGRRASLVAAAVWCAGLSAQATGAAGAMLLALALPLAAFASAGTRLPHTALRALAAAVAGAGAVFALDGLLRVEVFYAVALWCAWVLLALRGAGPEARVYSRG